MEDEAWQGWKPHRRKRLPCRSGRHNTWHSVLASCPSPLIYLCIFKNVDTMYISMFRRAARADRVGTVLGFTFLAGLLGLTSLFPCGLQSPTPNKGLQCHAEFFWIQSNLTHLIFFFFFWKSTLPHFLPLASSGNCHNVSRYMSALKCLLVGKETLYLVLKSTYVP